MKKNTLQMLAVLSLVLVVLASSALAASKESPKSTKWGLGFGSLNIAGSEVTYAGAAFDIGNRMYVEADLTLPSSSPFVFGAGGKFKYDVSESQNAGLHVGGTIMLGAASATNAFGATGSSFVMNFGGIGGLHFEIPGVSHVQFSFEGGPIMSLVSSSANFKINALSGLLGLSVFYFL